MHGCFSFKKCIFLCPHVPQLRTLWWNMAVGDFMRTTLTAPQLTCWNPGANSYACLSMLGNHVNIFLRKYHWSTTSFWKAIKMHCQNVTICFNSVHIHLQYKSYNITVIRGCLIGIMGGRTFYSSLLHISLTCIMLIY